MLNEIYWGISSGGLLQSIESLARALAYILGQFIPRPITQRRADKSECNIRANLFEKSLCV